MSDNGWDQWYTEDGDIVRFEFDAERRQMIVRMTSPDGHEQAVGHMSPAESELFLACQEIQDAGLAESCEHDER